MTDLILGWGKTGKSIANYLESEKIIDYKIWDDFNTLDEVERQESNLEKINRLIEKIGL